MTDPMGGGSGAALKQIEAAEPELAALRRGGLPPDEARGCILRVSNSVDRALRRLLRDDERADLDVRLRALAPDELSTVDVLAELRRIDGLPMEVAAGVHELLESRRRLERGGTVEPGDAARTIQTVDRLKVEMTHRPPTVATQPPAADDSPPDLTEEAPAPPPRRRRGATAPIAIAVGALVIMALAIVVWRAMDRGPSEFERGVALFRSGAYADAASHFWRFAEANPDDATPHLYLARIHRRMDRPELAADALREAQRLAPDDPAVHRELGFLLLDTNRADVAVERFRAAIQMEPESSEGYVGLVRALRESGREDEVAQVLQAAPAEVQALLQRPAVN